MSTPAVLALEDGTVFRGVSVGAKGNTTGEVVFNTAMTGYQEILTDPSYCRQIVTLTYPHIGNTGTTPEDLESGAVYAAGLVIRDMPPLHSNWRANESLGNFLLRCKVAAIADIDTRKSTRLLREKGAQAGCIMTGENLDETAAVRAARKFPGLKGMDLAKAVSTKKIYQWNEELIWKSTAKPPRPQSRLHVVAYDFGIKRNILRILAEHGCRMTVVPAQTPADQVLAINPDGIFLSNDRVIPSPATMPSRRSRARLDKVLHTVFTQSYSTLRWSRQFGSDMAYGSSKMAAMATRPHSGETQNAASGLGRNVRPQPDRAHREYSAAAPGRAHHRPARRSTSG